MKSSKLEISKEPGLNVYTRGNDTIFSVQRMSVSMNRINIPVGAAKALKIKQGSTITFVNLAEDWYFVIDVDEGGYHCSFEIKDRSGVRIGATRIARALLQKYGGGKTIISFIFEKHDRYEYKGKPMYKLNFEDKK